MENRPSFILAWQDHYVNHFSDGHIEAIDQQDGIDTTFYIQSQLLKKGNEPRIFYHGHPTKDVFVLTHGLSDSPFYMTSIAKMLYRQGVNVILPLLPGHGLNEPDKALEDKNLDTKWQLEMDIAVNIAQQLGERISLGGFSTGGALNINKALRHPQLINGGLFLFAAALNIGTLNEFFSKSDLLQRFIKKEQIIGHGPNPYKYPTFPVFGAMELVDIIEKNDAILKKKKVTQPVFAAHSIHDNTAKLEGILELMEKKTKVGVTYILSHHTKIAHAETTLAEDIPLISNPKKETAPRANPLFDNMMKACIDFFEEYVRVG